MAHPANFRPVTLLLDGKSLPLAQDPPIPGHTPLFSPGIHIDGWEIWVLLLFASSWQSSLTYASY